MKLALTKKYGRRAVNGRRRDVWGSVRVGRKKPKGEWLSYEAKVTVEQKRRL